MPSIHDLRKDFQRATGKTLFIASLGDANGVLDEPGRPGYVRVRYWQADGLGQPTTLLFLAVTQKERGNPVEIGYSSTGELAVLRPHVPGQLAAGFNPLGNNALDENVSHFINFSQLTPLLCHPVSSASASMLVTVEPFLYVLDGTLHYFLGGDGDGATPVDLTSYIPGSSDKQCVACLFLDPADDTIEIQTSTPIDIADDLGIADVQECITASTAGTLPIHAWRLYNGQTTINPGDVPSGGDDFLDLRQFINTVSSSGSGAPSDAHYVTTQAESGLSNEFNLGSLTTGLLKHSVTTGVSTPATAVAGTDYTTPTGTENLSNKTITASSLIATALSLLIGGFKAIFTHSNSADRTYTLPNYDGTLATLAGTETLTNKTFSADIVSDKLIFNEWSESGTPSSDTLWVYAADDNGFSVWRLIDSTGAILQVVRDVVTVCRNESGSTINAGSAVNFSGASGGIPKAVLATTVLTYRSLPNGFAMDTAAHNANLRVMTSGIMPFDTSGFSAGAKLFADSSGAVTSTNPSASSGKWSQVVAVALDSSASGHILVVIQPGDPAQLPGSLSVGGAEVDFQKSGFSLNLVAAALSADRVATLPNLTGTVLLTTSTIDGSQIGTGTVAAARLGVMTGDSGSGGAKGAAPAPATGDSNKALLGNATYGFPHIPFAVIEDQKSTNTAGGGSTATTWTTRDLNTEVVDADSIVTISSNQFTPIAGVFRIHAESPFLPNTTTLTEVRIRLRNITAGTTVIVSTNYSLSNVLACATAFIDYIFTANGSDAYAIQYYITTAKTTNGLGLAINEGSEVERYTRVMLEKIA